MGAATWGVDSVLAAALPAAGTLRYAVRLAAVIPAAVVVFWAACRALGVPVPRLQSLRRGR